MPFSRQMFQNLQKKKKNVLNKSFHWTYNEWIFVARKILDQVPQSWIGRQDEVIKITPLNQLQRAIIPCAFMIPRVII